MNQNVDVSVVIACHDMQRWPFLVAAVESVLGQDVASRLIIAVDHNPALADRVQRTWPQALVVENRHGRGASGTRNSGAEHADTPFIAFLDDDACAHPHWLARLLAPFTDPDVVGTGGGVDAAWALGRPRWFPREFDWAVGASYRGMPTRTARVRNVWSENMAVRTDVFRAVGGFRLDFGKVGERSRPEDTDLCIRMGSTPRDGAPAGHWMYVPDALADHHVPAGRSTFGFFVRRSYLEGAGKVEMSRLLGPQEKLADERAYMTRVLPSGVLGGLAAALRGDGSGLLQAAAITTGLASAAVGAARALLTRPRAAAPSIVPRQGQTTQSSLTRRPAAPTVPAQSRSESGGPSADDSPRQEVA